MMQVTILKTLNVTTIFYMLRNIIVRILRQVKIKQIYIYIYIYIYKYIYK